MDAPVTLKNPTNRPIRISEGGVVVRIAPHGTRRVGNPRLVYRLQSKGAVYASEQNPTPAPPATDGHADEPASEAEPAEEYLTVPAAVDHILDKGSQDDLTTQGAPKTSKVSELVGRKVYAAEIDTYLNAE